MPEKRIVRARYKGISRRKTYHVLTIPKNKHGIVGNIYLPIGEQAFEGYNVVIWPASTSKKIKKGKTAKQEDDIPF